MGMWKDEIERSKYGDPRRPSGDMEGHIKRFFERQKKVTSYEIVDRQNWVVNIEGSIEINSADLFDRSIGVWPYQTVLRRRELPFNIGKVSGDIIIKCCGAEHLSSLLNPTK